MNKIQDFKKAIRDHEMISIPRHLHLEFQVHWLDLLQFFVHFPLLCLPHHNLMSAEIYFT